jgi:hypothetical protein
MTRSNKTTGLLLAGAVAVAAAGYSVGSQRDDGTAAAAGSGPSTEARFVHARGPREHLSSLADALGVSEEKLRAALDDIRDEAEPKPRRDSRVADLAAAIGVTVRELRQALRAVRPERPGRGHGFDAAALAEELGVAQAKVEEAFDRLREQHEAEHERRFDAFVKALAAKLNLAEDKVRQALEDARPAFGGGGPRDRGPCGP